MWNKPYFITSVIIGSSFLGTLILELIKMLMGAERERIFLPIAHISAYIVGQTYASKQHKLMPRSLRLWSAIYCGLWTCLSLIIFMLSINPSSFTFSTIPYATPLFIILLPSFSSILLYWLMGLGAKSHLKKMGI
jgi:hypothetical protein